MSAPRLPWMKLYTGDFLASTAGLKLEALGAVILLAMAQWENGPLPHDRAVLARLCRTTPAKFKKQLWPPISRRFTVRPDGLVDEALERVRQKCLHDYEKQSQSARDTNRKKLAKLKDQVARRGAQRPGERTVTDSVTVTVTDTVTGSHPEPEPEQTKIQEAERARTADSKQRRARAEKSGRIDESDPEVQRRRREAAALLANDSPTEGNA